MKQVFQDVSGGRSEVVCVPRPACKQDHLIIESVTSLISAGTERMLVDFSRAGYLRKAQQQPEKVRMVLDKIKTDGLMSTVEAVRSKLDEPIPMGYSNVGRVVEIGSGVTDFSVGDRVLSNGHHAEVVCIGKNLCAKVPDDVPDDSAVFGVVGSIALQGIRLAQPTTGECFVVVGLGLIGLMTVQILRASGCRVLGTDYDESKLEIARSFGAMTVNLSQGEDAVKIAMAFSRGRGVDGVIITASANSNEPIQQSAHMCRKRGRIVLIGVVGLDLNRADFFEKELTFQVSCSYGPGRYDSNYEEGGNDYPVGFVRWTEQRNFEAVLDMLSSGQVKTDELQSAAFDIDNAGDAYDLLISDRSVLGVLISYPDSCADKESRREKLSDVSGTGEGRGAQGIVGAIGAGNYAGRVLLPSFSKAGAHLHTIVSSQGVSGSHVGRKLGFGISSTDTSDLFGNTDIDTIVVATQHDSHARFTVDALDAGKHVFIEKPLALSMDDLDAIDNAYRAAWGRGDNPLLMVGFNRRFAPLMLKLKTKIAMSSEPISLIYTCNAGGIDADSWVQDPERGGGRIVGEACHFIDVARFLANSRIEKVTVMTMTDGSVTRDCRDTATISIGFENGSLAVVNYFSNGHRSYPKERVEVYQAGNVMIMENFRALRLYGSSSSTTRSLRADRGQIQCVKAFVDAVRGETATPIPYEELMEVSRAAVDAAQQTVG